MSLYQTEAIILTARDWGNADRIITLFSRQTGKIKAVVYGVRQARSQLVGAVQPFTQVNLSLSSGKNMDIVRQSQILNPFLPIKQDLVKMAYACFIAELAIELLSEREPQDEVYYLLAGALQTIIDYNPRLAVQAFAWQLLALCGYQPVCDSCVYCGKQLLFPAFFDIASGGGVCHACTHGEKLVFDKSASELLHTCVALDLSAPQRFTVSGVALMQLEAILHGFLLHVVEKPLKSLAFIRTVTS